jgi:hypothetical protein
MAVAVANTTFATSAGGATTAVVSVVRAAGEGLLVAVFREYTLGSTVDTISSVVWDAAGDNQALTLVHEQQEALSASRYLAVYDLAAPSSVKTGNVTVTFSGTANHDNDAILVRHITGHDTSAMLRGAAEFSQDFYDANPMSDSIASASGDLVIDFMSCRLGTADFAANGSQGNVSENATNIASRSLSSSSKAGGTSVAMAWTTTATGATNWSSAHILVSVQPAAGGPVDVGLSGSASTTGHGTQTPGIAVEL